MTQKEIIEEAILIKGGWAASIRWAIEQEREACAKVCDGFVNRTQDNYSDLCANAIRARGTNE
jgi:hypothetical protein